MAFQSVADTAEAVINFDNIGQPGINRVNFQKTGGYDQDDIDALAALVDAWVFDDYLPLINIGVDYLFTRVRGLESAVDLEATEDENAGPGTQAGTGAPAQQSFVTQLQTGATGRSARGRFYWMPTVITVFDTARTLLQAQADAYVDAMADLVAAAAAVGWDMVVTSRYTAGAARPTGVNRIVTDVTAPNLNLDTQRRRVGK